MSLTRGRAVRLGAAVAVAAGTAGLLGITSATAAPTAAARPHCHVSITKQFFGMAPANPYQPAQRVFRFTLTNARCMQVKIITYGAIVQSITAPDRRGHLADVVLGFKTLADYVNLDSPPPGTPGFGGPYFGETIGRYANRIGGASFSLQGHTYTLPVNNGPNTLHGGYVGWGSRTWQNPVAVVRNGVTSLTMSLVAPNGDEGSGLLRGTKVYEPNCNLLGTTPTKCTGFPARVTTFITYSFDNAGRLGIHYRAHNDSSKLATVINLTNHSYFNLAGEASAPGSAYRQEVLINANSFTPTDANLIPTGAIVPVKGTPFDFRTFHAIGERIGDASAPQGNQLVLAHGYDHNWVLNLRPGQFGLAAAAFDPASGRTLIVRTDEPGVQFYTGNFLDGHLVGISGHTYRQGAGYTFETQHFPNSPNQPSFPSTVLRPGQTFTTTTVFAFGAVPGVTMSLPRN